MSTLPLDSSDLFESNEPKDGEIVPKFKKKGLKSKDVTRVAASLVEEVPKEEGPSVSAVKYVP